LSDAPALTREDPASASLEAGGAPIWDGPLTAGRNGVAVARRAVTKGAGYRSYEVHQRMRVAQNTEKLNPSRLMSPEFARDPYPAFEILREHYPCYRDWIGNAYWISRYDDVTSVFVDDANFESRSKLWFYGAEGFGRDLRGELPVLMAQAAMIDRHSGPVAHDVIDTFAADGEADLALAFAARYPLALLARVLDLPRGDFDHFAERYWTAQRGWDWDPVAERDGLAALRDLADYVRPLLAARRRAPGEDLISAIAGLDLKGGPATAEDVVATLLEGDHETLHGALANLWFLLLTHPDQLDRVRADRRLVKFAYLETLRHSAPVLTARRFARHEVERFGVLIPEGALVVCAAGAGNRDPRIFSSPDRFIIERKDLCPREPRGQYRADGLPAGIAFGLGKPSKYPALPEDRPRSLYALTRDVAVAASNILLDRLANLRLKTGAAPTLRSLRVGEMHGCWSLPVDFEAA
jgi:pulcherriminic acid synthase